VVAATAATATATSSVTASFFFVTANAVQWRAPLALAALLLLLQAGGAPVREALRYERGAVLHGELWRLFTAHAVHLGWTHALLNTAGLLLCAALAPASLARLSWPRQALYLLALAGTVSLMLLLFSPHVGNYVGLSGVLYGLFACVLFAQAGRGGRPEAAALLLLAAWVAWQWLAGPCAQEERWIGGRIVAQAHLYGLLGAAGFGAAMAFRARRPA
jgi:rhomboid family GlyGly-CTERM serine protease